MLILTRNIGECIYFEHNKTVARIEFLGIRGWSIRLGILAVPEVQIARGEIINVTRKDILDKMLGAGD
jgi:carbon storage regulator CsrA